MLYYLLYSLKHTYSTGASFGRVSDHFITMVWYGRILLQSDQCLWKYWDQNICLSGTSKYFYMYIIYMNLFKKIRDTFVHLIFCFSYGISFHIFFTVISFAIYLHNYSVELMSIMINWCETHSKYFQIKNI